MLQPWSHSEYAMMNKATTEDAYTVLELGEPYTDLSGLRNSEIRRAYRAQALRLHPDKNVGDEHASARFAAATAAFETLCDVQRRRELDSRRAAFARQHAHRAQLDERRRRLRDDLAASENAAAHAATSAAVDAKTLSRLQDEMRALREQKTQYRSTMNAASREHISDESPWARVPGYAEFMAARLPFDEFESAVLDTAHAVD